MKVLISSEMHQENAEAAQLQGSPFRVCMAERNLESGEYSERWPMDSGSLQSGNKAVLLAGEGTHCVLMATVPDCHFQAVITDTGLRASPHPSVGGHCPDPWALTTGTTHAWCGPKTLKVGELSGF